MKPTESQDSSLKGSNLIFLISQPRAGSTLTQRILGGHPDIHTVSEPWLMLSPLTAWHSTIGYNADYDQALAQVAVSSFIGSLSQGEEDYVQGLRRMYSYLYEKAREEAGKRYFLDKTPRYFYIINELYRTFPEARFIFLFRNPLSVLCSIVTTWGNDDLHGLYTLKQYKNDLFIAPQKLLEGVSNLGKQCLVMHYEWLLMSSDEEIARVCDFLGISFRPEVAEYGVTNTSPAWMYGDQLKLYQNTKPDSSNLNKWLEDIKQPQIWRLASDYLQILGEETIEKLGYSYQELWSTLNQEVPTIKQLKDTLPLEFYCEETLSSRSEVSHFIQLTQKSLGGWIGAKKETGDALYGLPKQQEAQYQESLTRVHKESQKLQTELERAQSQLHQTQAELEQSQSQLHQTHELLEQFQYQMQQAETLWQEYQVQLHLTQAELEQSQSQLHQTQAELEQSQDQMQQAEILLQEDQVQLHLTQVELEQSESQLHQTQAELEQSQSQLHQTQSELQECKEELGEFQAIAEQLQEQLHQTHAVLEQSESQLHQTQSELQECKEELGEFQAIAEQLQEQLHQTHAVLEQSQGKLHETQTELAQTKSKLYQSHWEEEKSRFQLHQTQAELANSQSELHQIKAQLQQSQSQVDESQSLFRQSQSQVDETQDLLRESQSQLYQNKNELKRVYHQLYHLQGEWEQSQLEVKQSQTVLKKFQSQIHENRSELKRADSQIHQIQGELEQSESQLHQTQEVLEQSESQLHQTQEVLEQYQSQLHQTQQELQQYQSQLHQTQQELEQLKSQFSQTQVELVRTRLQNQYVTTESLLTTGTEYKLLVWDAWYAYQSGDLKKMQQCLQESLKLTPLSRTESVINWLESFSKFSSETGDYFDSYTLTNSPEWKRLIQQRVNVSKR